MSNRKLLKSTIILASAGLISKFIGFFLRVPLMKLIGTEGFGIYNYPYTLYASMLAISVNGIPTVISKLVSERIALGKHNQAHRVLKIALVMITSIGVLASLILYFGAGLLVGTIWPKTTYYALMGLILAPIFVAILAVFRGYFQGLQMMSATSVSQIIESIGRLVFGLGIAYLFINKGIEYAAGGAAFGATSGAFVGMIVIIIYYFIMKPKISVDGENLEVEESNKEIARTILSMSIPISIGALAGQMMPLVDSVIVSSRLQHAGYTINEATSLYGDLSGCNTLVNLPLSISVAIAMSLVPAIAYANANGSIDQVRSRVNNGVRLGAFLAFPSAVGLFVLAESILAMVFPDIQNGENILRLLCIGLIFIALNQIFTSTIQAMGHFTRPVKHLFIGTAFKATISFLLLGFSNLNILGAVIGTTIGYIISTILNYRYLKGLIRVNLDIKNIFIKPIFSSIVMGLVVWVLSLNLLNSHIGLIINVIIGAVIYAVMTITTKCVTKQELLRIIGK